MANKVKGTVDFYPREKAVQKYIFSVFREIAERYNFQEIETPVFEELATLTEKEGEEIKEQIFVLEKRSKEQLGLRFDMTVPVVRLYCQQGKTLAKPVQWYYIDKNWRYERPQAGRLREFYQFGVECLGSSDPLADAQVIQLAIDALKALGLDNNDFFVRLNNRKLLQGLLANLVDEDRFDEAVSIIDKREKVDEDTFFELLKGVGVRDPSKIVEVIELTEIEDLEKIGLNKVGQEGLKELKAVYEAVDKDYVRISLDTVRGLAYYTSTVFEIFDTGNKFRSISGGGRYDRLVEQFGGEKTPATGFGMGYSTLTLLLEDKGLMPEVRLEPKYYVAAVTDSVKKEAMEIAQLLRMKNPVQLGLSARNLGKQFSYADAIGADYVIIVGDKDLAEKQVTLRDMETGEEKKLPLDKLTEL